MGIVVTSVVFLTMAMVPIMGFFVGIFAPLLVFYFSRSSRVQGILVLMLSLIPSLIVLKSLNIEGNFPFLFSWGSVGVFLSEFIRKKYPLDKTVCFCVLVILTMAAAFLLSYSFRVGEDPRLLVETYIRQGVQEGIRVYEQASLAPEQVKLIRDQSPEIIKTVYHMFPAMMIISAVFFVWINVMAARSLFLWRKLPFPIAGDPAQWKIPDKVVWLVIASGALILVPVDSVWITGLNLISVFLFAYFFQGLAIVHFFFQKKRVPPVLRGISYLLIFVQHILLLIVIGIGFSDIWIDFRKINREVNLPAEENGETH